MEQAREIYNKKTKNKNRVDRISGFTMATIWEEVTNYNRKKTSLKTDPSAITV